MVKYQKYFNILFVLILLINDSFFYILFETNTTILVSLISIVLFVLLFLKHKIPFDADFSWMIVLLILMMLASVLYSCFIYEQSIFSGLGNINRYFIYLLYFVFMTIYNKNGRIKLLELFSNLAVIIAIVFLIQRLLYPNIVFFKNFVIRNGQIRLMVNTSVFFYAVALFVTKILVYHKSRDVLKLLVIILAIIFCVQSRGELMFYFIASISTILFYTFVYSKKNIKHYLVIFMPIIIIIAIMAFFNIFDNILSSLIYELNNGGSAITRVNEIIYYYNLLKENFVFGLGNLTGDLADKIYGTTQYYFYTEDIGILVIIVKNGLIGFIWLLLYFVLLFIKLKKNRYDKISFTLLIFYLSYVLPSFFYSNLIFDRQNIFLNSLLLSIFSHESNRKRQVQTYSLSYNERLFV